MLQKTVGYLTLIPPSVLLYLTMKGMGPVSSGLSLQNSEGNFPLSLLSQICQYHDHPWKVILLTASQAELRP